MPSVWRDDDLGSLALGDVDSEYVGFTIDNQLEGITSVKVPNLRGVDAMSSGPLPSTQQVVDRGPRASSGIFPDITPRFAEVASLGVWFESKSLDGFF